MAIQKKVVKKYILDLQQMIPSGSNTPKSRRFTSTGPIPNTERSKVFNNGASQRTSITREQIDEELNDPLINNEEPVGGSSIVPQENPTSEGNVDNFDNVENGRRL